jgi:hypothetical protein
MHVPTYTKQTLAMVLQPSMVARCAANKATKVQQSSILVFRIDHGYYRSILCSAQSPSSCNGGSFMRPCFQLHSLCTFMSLHVCHLVLLTARMLDSSS